jgi:protease-4
LSSGSSKTQTTSGSSYRPYYSYADQNPPKQSAQTPASYPTVSTIPKVEKERADAPKAQSAPPAPSAPSAPPAKKSGSGKKVLIIAAVIGLLLFATVGMIFIAALDSSGGSYSGSSGKVAVIHVNGPMYTGDYYYGSGYAGSDAICRHIRAAANNKSIDAIVLRIDSPGGTASAAQEINYEIKRAQAMGKPVVVSMGDQATSAAYYVASQTDYIYATQSTITGSIGVIGVHYDLSEAYEDEGIRVDVFKSGEMKDMGAGYRALTTEEERYWQYIIDESFKVFVNDVAAGRNMTPEDVLKLSDGRVYLATDAKRNGLIDDYGNLYDAAEKAAALAGYSNYTLHIMDNITLTSLFW